VFPGSVDIKTLGLNDREFVTFAQSVGYARYGGGHAYQCICISLAGNFWKKSPEKAVGPARVRTQKHSEPHFTCREFLDKKVQKRGPPEYAVQCVDREVDARRDRSDDAHKAL
jgi:hypothetical protein